MVLESDFPMHSHFQSQYLVTLPPRLYTAIVSGLYKNTVTAAVDRPFKRKLDPDF